MPAAVDEVADELALRTLVARREVLGVAGRHADAGLLALRGEVGLGAGLRLFGVGDEGALAGGLLLGAAGGRAALAGGTPLTTSVRRCIVRMRVLQVSWPREILGDSLGVHLRLPA